MQSSNFHAFVEPARAYPQIWRLVLGLVLAAIVYGAVVGAIFFGAQATLGAGGGPNWIDEAMRALTPRGMLIVLASFVGMALGAMAAARVLHKRPSHTLFGPLATTFRHFCLAALAMGAILTVSVVVWSLVYDAAPGLAFGAWIKLLPFALLGVLVQTGAEELLFRGYLQQQLAARFASPVIWALLPSFLFGVLHYDPISAGPNVWLIVGAAAVFGLIAADLTARTGSIGAAWGLHFANNTFALLIIATDGTMTGLALNRTPYAVDDVDTLRTLIPIDIALLLFGWWLIRRIIATR